MARIDANLRAKFVSPVRQKPRLAQSLQRGTIARNSFAMSEGSSGREFVGSNLQRRTAGRDETHKTGRRGLLFRLTLPLDFLGSATNTILDVGLLLTCKGFRLAHYDLGGTRSQGNIGQCQPACAVVRIDGDDAACATLIWRQGWAWCGSGWLLHELVKMPQWEFLFDTVQCV